jgi:hypothetical protein
MMWMRWLKGISRSICFRNSSHWRWVCVDFEKETGLRLCGLADVEKGSSYLKG